MRVGVFPYEKKEVGMGDSLPHARGGVNLQQKNGHPKKP